MAAFSRGDRDSVLNEEGTLTQKRRRTVRKLFLAAFLVGLGLATPALAQQRRSAFQSINPNDIKNVPIDTSRAIAPPLPFQQQRPSGLKSFFSSFHLPGFLGGTPNTAAGMPSSMKANRSRSSAAAPIRMP
jgi:hypothetical protein